MSTLSELKQRQIALTRRRIEVDAELGKLKKGIGVLVVQKKYARHHGLEYSASDNFRLRQLNERKQESLSQLQEILLQLTVLKSELAACHTSSERSFNKEFVRVASQMLDVTLFEAISAKAAQGGSES